MSESKVKVPSLSLFLLVLRVMVFMFVLVSILSKAKAYISTNQQIFNPDALKEQDIACACHFPINNLPLHRGETLMRCNYDDDNRVTEFPWSHISKVSDRLSLAKPFPWSHNPKVSDNLPALCIWHWECTQVQN